MIKHYVSLAVRNARREPVAAAINMLTLALGLVSFLLAYALVAFWDRAEQAFPDADRTFLLTTSFTTIDGTFSRSGLTTSPHRAGELLRADFPAIERAARAIPFARDGRVDGRACVAFPGRGRRSGVSLDLPAAPPSWPGRSLAPTLS